METQKKVTKRKPAKRKPATKKKPEIISYAIKMVIPTVQYGNIQPEIIVKTNSIEEAHDFIVPHMNKLWKEYYLVDGRRPEPVPPAPAPTVTPTPVTPAPVTPAPVTPAPVTPAPVTPEPVTPAPVVESQPPASSVALVKATQAIQSCMSLEALQLIVDQVYASVKLTDEDKISLEPLLETKSTELEEKNK